MKQVVIDRDGMRYKWVVLGLDEDACAADIEVKQMTEMSDYIGTVFGEKYGCAVTLEPVRLMSRNQYQAYLQGNAQRMVDDVGYTIDDYRRDAKRVEVLPFQLDGFRLSSGQKAVMDNRFTSISYTQEGDACLRGRVGSTVGVGLIAKELGCELVCKQDFSGFYKSDLHKFILEFADGDVSLLICKSHMSYANRLAELHQNFEISGYDVCLEIYFDNVHMDNMFVPREHVPMAISSLMQRGFEGYHQAVKDSWLELLEKKKNPNISFRMIETPTMVRDVDAVLVQAAEKSSVTERTATNLDALMR